VALNSTIVIKIYPFISNIVFCLLLVGLDVSAQSPGLINYQAVARDTETGAQIANQQVFLSVIVRAGGPGGDVVYQESHGNVGTNAFGLFNIQIGGGEVLTGNLSEINWATGSYWLEMELDAGSGLESVGAMQLLAVPYALHANTVTNADDADADPSNELITQFEFDPATSSLVVGEGDNQLEVSLDALIQDADADPNNELVQAFDFNPETSVLSLQDQGNNFQLDLGPLIDDADADSTNELITGIFFSAGSNTLTVSEGGQNYSTGLGAVDLDINPNNELITALVLTDNNVLEITEGLNIQTIDLTPLTEQMAWVRDAGLELVYNLNDKVGIGTDSPVAKLQVQGDGIENEPLLSIQSQPDGEVLRVSSDSIVTGPQSSLYIKGSIGFESVVLPPATALDSEYTVAPGDSHIICLVQASVNRQIFMPPAASHPGRRILVRMTGPQPISGSVAVIFEAGELDFGFNVYALTGFSPVTAEFLSLGVNGWTRIY
jgi:hypothetical protein